MKTKKIDIEYNIRKEQEWQYLFIPFEVPRNVRRMEVSYDYIRYETLCEENETKEFEVNIVDIGLHDEKDEFRGASGSNKRCFFLEENRSTPGYLNGEIVAGTWQIMLGAYKIKEEGCRVQVKITLHFKERVLLKGDIHTHSSSSDGDYDVRDQIRIAHLMKLDYLFLTDHNNYHQNSFILPSEDLVVLPGMELTLYNGHCSLLGVDKPLSSFFSNDKEVLIKNLEIARSKGAIIIINHPFDDQPWRWGFDVPFDAIEIQNSFYDDRYDRQALALWQNQLVANRRIPIVAGSDNHGIRFIQTLGSPTTCLYANSNGRKDILKAIRRGNCFVSCFLDGPEISIRIDDYIMGDMVPKEIDSDVIFEANALKAGDVLKIITNQGEVFQEMNVDAKSKKIEYKQDGSTFYRMEIWRKITPTVEILGAISNPIYIGEEAWT
jgi:hypothetical protein